jgi:hypothetical protein
MAQPAAVVFALSMAIWVADVGLAPRPAPSSSAAPVTACQSASSESAPAGTDAELVICGARVAQ